VAPESSEGAELGTPGVPAATPVAEVGTRPLTPDGTEVGSNGDGGDAGPPAGTGEQPPPARSRRRRWLIEWAVIIALAVIVAVVVRAFVFQTFYIPSGSMEPTLNIGDRIVVNKLSYTFHSPNRGDIVVFTTPPNEHCAGPPVPDLVKRIIGMPGESISAANGKVDINGKPLNETWLPKIPSSYTSTFGPVRIPKGDYFMMGDNRVDSCDSRMWGPVSGSTFVGHVILRIWPISKIKFFF
jgi:signal peptidase I